MEERVRNLFFHLMTNPHSETLKIMSSTIILELSKLRFLNGALSLIHQIFNKKIIDYANGSFIRKSCSRTC